MSNVFGVSHSITTSTSVGLYVSTITDEEQKELDALEEEFISWKKQKELEVFITLPAEIRQDIINELIIIEAMDKMDNLDSSEFEDYTKLAQLRFKKDGYHGNIYTGAYVTPFVSKYQTMFNKFTKEELMEAHASASLEEQLYDTE